MKKYFLLLIFVLSVFCSSAQNYFQEFPINSSIAFNGNQQRMELTVYDSTIQTTVSYNSPWMNCIFFMENNYNKIAFTTWINMGQQNADYGFIIYDYLLHEFAVKWINNGMTSNERIVTGCGPKWFGDVIEHETSPNSFSYYYNYYRYNLQFHKWSQASIYPDLNGDPYYGSIAGTPGLSELIAYIDDEDEGDFYYFDAGSGNISYFSSGCAGWGFDVTDDYITMDMGCLDNYRSLTFDAEYHGFTGFYRPQLLSGQTHGIFSAIDQDSSNKHFFFTYDQAIHQWLADSTNTPNMSNGIIKNRVVAYVDQTPGYSKKVFCLVHNPILHTWVKDSTTVAGAVSGLTITNGTVSWTDGNGLNTRGYDINSGWGNYNTPLFLYYHLTNFSSQGQSLVHVRNYSIGTDKIYYDFGDGTTSSNNTHVLWHQYRDSGTYNICIYDSSGLQSFCQSVTFNTCSQSGIASISNDTICYGDSINLSLSSYTGNIQWQRVVSGSWTNETGPGANTDHYSTLPLQNSSFRAVVTNGSCIQAFSSVKSVVVNPIAYKGSIVDSTYYVCQGARVKLYVTGSVGSIQWQKNEGTGWTNILNANYLIYMDTVDVNTQYRAILSSGSCTSDTSDLITATVIPKPPMPATIGTTQCGLGFSTLTATGTGTLNWHTGSLFSTPRVFTGSQYTTYIDSTTSFYVHSLTGSNEVAGFPDNGFGNVSVMNSKNTGLRIVSTTPATLERITIYPQQSGSIRIFLYKAGTNEVFSSMYSNVPTAFVPTEIYLGMELQGNQPYDLIFVSYDFNMDVNTSNAVYPQTVPGSNVTVIGYINSGVFSTDSSFYNIYKIKISSGCKSNPHIVTATYHPDINSDLLPNGHLSFCQGGSVTFQATPTGGYFYKWFKNGVQIPGAVLTTYNATQAGNYNVVINNQYCADTSSALTVTIPCLPPADPVEKNNSETSTTTGSQYSVYYDAITGNLIIKAVVNEGENYLISLMDYAGKEIIHRNIEFNKGENQFTLNIQSLAAGLYIAKMQSNKNRFIQRFLKY